jgi:A/G-specific adenine glycosylase
VTVEAPGPQLAPLRRAVLEWYASGHRSLPWRGTRDPYAVLISEVMLQQTQASRVAVRYPRFMSRFPDVGALASASEAAVLAEWSGLGYNRRALSLRRVAVAVAAGGWPADLDGLLRLPGIGAYTARAIGSIAFSWPVGVVDTNVRRWLVRRFGLDLDGPATAAAALQRLADALAIDTDSRSPEEIAAWTHASMDLGAVVCRPRRPACDHCPVAIGCPARGLAQRVPVPRQARFRGSRRAYRGAIVRALAAAPDHALSRQEALTATELPGAGLMGETFDPHLAAAALAELERDGLAHREGEWLRLGPSGLAAMKPSTAGAYNRADDRGTAGQTGTGSAATRRGQLP